VRNRWCSALAVWAVVVAAGALGVQGAAAAAGGGPRSWAHPRVEGWHSANAADIDAVVSDATALLSALRSHPLHCDATSGGGTNCGTVAGSPTSWPTDLTDQQCSALAGAVTKARSDRPVPSAKAERSWSSALSALTAACHNVGLAIAALSTPAGPDEATYVPTLSSIQTNLTVINRLIQYAAARRSSRS